MTEGPDTWDDPQEADTALPPEPPDPAWLPALVAALAAFVLYAVTLAPSTAFWDTSEYIATAHIFGIPHPPGNPFFVAVAKTWSLLLAPAGLSVAVRINLLAAATSAGATGFLYLISHRVLAAFFEQDRFARIGAAASVVLGATAFTVWNQSNVNEKVYTLSVLIIAAVSWLGIHWYDRRNEAGSERLLLWAIFLIAIGSTSHMMSVLPAPALGVLVLLSRSLRLLRPAFVVRGLALVLLGLSFNFVLPVRASLDPVINEGDPTCASVFDAAGAIYSNGRIGCQALGSNLTREQYATPPITERKAPFSAQMAMYGQYFEWQWARGLDPSELPIPERLPFTLLFLTLGVVGLGATWRVDRAVFGYLAVLTTTLTVGLVVYLNFKYGYSLSPEIADAAQHEVRERDYFFVAGFLLWGCLAGIGLAWTWHTVARAIGGGPKRYWLTAPVLAIALIPLGLNWSWASRSGDYAARDWAFDLLMSVEPYGILFTNGDNDTFPLWYLQEVEGIRKDVTVIVGQYLYTTWYPKQLQELTLPDKQRPFDSTLSAGIYADRDAPAGPIVDLTHELLDQVVTVRLAEDLTIPFPKLAVTYPEGMVLNRGQQLALSIIHDSVDDRPIFFSAAGGLLAELGLDRWGVRHGLVTKLSLRNIETDPNEGLVQGTEDYGAIWFDFGQSRKLYEEVYQFRGILDRPIWQDRSTLNIPFQYYVMALQLADVSIVAGTDSEVTERLQRDAISFQIVSQGGRFGTPGRLALENR
jgi:hypothetical protein